MLSYNRLIGLRPESGGYMKFIEQNIKIVKVTGEASLQLMPDQAILTLGVHTENKDPKIAQQENAVTISQMIQALKNIGISEDNMKTSHYRVNPQYHYEHGKVFLQHYRVEHMFQIHTNDISQVGTILDTAVSNGANIVSNVSFSLANPAYYYNQALNQALQIAYAKAQALTKDLGVHLNPIPVSIEEVSAPPTPVVFQMSEFTKASPTPFTPGQLEMTATVIAKYTY